MTEASIFSFPHRSARQGLPAPLVQSAERELALLDVRRKHLPSSQLSDAQWSILLALYVARANRRQVTMIALADVAGVSRGTLLRYLQDLDEQGFVACPTDAHDRRADHAEITERGCVQVGAILAEANDVPARTTAQ
jgi:DNA-binding MarR family transcriptional regulator